MTKTNQKKPSESKRVPFPREVSFSDKFVKNWKKISRSGKHDMHVLKEAMTLLFANDAPLPPEWKDHQLKGELGNFRECHIKGDLLLMYQLRKKSYGEIIVFHRLGSHSEVL